MSDIKIEYSGKDKDIRVILGGGRDDQKLENPSLEPDPDQAPSELTSGPIIVPEASVESIGQAVTNGDLSAIRSVRESIQARIAESSGEAIPLASDTVLPGSSVFTEGVAHDETAAYRAVDDEAYDDYYDEYEQQSFWHDRRVQIGTVASALVLFASFWYVENKTGSEQSDIAAILRDKTASDTTTAEQAPVETTPKTTVIEPTTTSTTVAPTTTETTVAPTTTETTAPPATTTTEAAKAAASHPNVSGKDGVLHYQGEEGDIYSSLAGAITRQLGVYSSKNTLLLAQEMEQANGPLRSESSITLPETFAGKLISSPVAAKAIHGIEYGGADRPRSNNLASMKVRNESELRANIAIWSKCFPSRSADILASQIASANGVDELSKLNYAQPLRICDSQKAINNCAVKSK